MKNVFLFIIFFFFIFGPIFRPVGDWMDLIFVTSLLITSYGAIILKLKIPRFIIPFTILFVVFSYLAASVTLYPFTTGGDYVRIFLIPIRIIVTLYGGYVLSYILHQDDSSNLFFKLLTFVFLVIVLHALIMVFQILNPKFKDFVYQYTTSGEFRSTYDYNFRMGGLSGGTGGSVLSTVQSLGIIIIPPLYKYLRSYWRLLVILGGILIFFSILICGRSGIWTTFVFLPLSIYLSSPKRGIKFLFNFLLKILFFTLFFVGIIALLEFMDVESPTFSALRRSLDTFLSFKESGSFQDETVDAIVDFILLPKDIFTLFFGNGEHFINTQFERTLDSDIGYIRNIWSMGLLTSIIYWFPIMYFTLVSVRNLNKYHSAIVLFSFSLIMLLLHAKESFLYVRMFFSIYSLFLFAFFLESRRSTQIY